MKSLGVALISVAVGATAAIAEPAKLWEATGFKTPESVLPVTAEGFAYVSNVDGEPLNKDGNGFISKLSLADGKILEQEWAKGFDAPKGMARNGGKLFVSDIDKLVEVDEASGKIAASHDAPGAEFLNDVAVDKDGNVYVSDSNTSTIWRLSGGKLEKWIEGPELKYPNGLFVDGDNLIVAAWGPPGTGNKKIEARLGNLLTIGIADKKVADLGDGSPLGNLDGIEPDGDDFIVSDWVAGAVYRIGRDGKATLLIDTDQGSADIGYVPADKLLLVPMMKDGKVVAYKLQ